MQAGLLNYYSLSRVETTMLQRRETKRAFIHPSLPRCNNVSIIIGVYVTGDWPESMDAFYFTVKGVTRRYWKTRPLRTRARPADAQLRFPQTGDNTPSPMPPTNRRREIKSVRFPRVSALLSQRGRKIRHRRRAGSPFHSIRLRQPAKLPRQNTRIRWAQSVAICSEM